MTTDPTTPPPADTGRLSDADLTAIRERAGRATEGPWYGCTANDGKCPCGLVWSDGVDDVVLTARSRDEKDGPSMSIPPEESYANRDFAAHARTDIPALLAEVARLRDKLASIDGVLQKCDRGNRDGWPGALLMIAEIVESVTT